MALTARAAGRYTARPPGVSVPPCIRWLEGDPLNMGSALASIRQDRERLATLGLWSVPGVGPRGLAGLRAWTGAGLAPLLEGPVEAWVERLEAPDAVRRALLEGPPLKARAEETLGLAARGEMEICFPGDPAWPGRLSEDAVPLLFFQGSPCAGRRWAALVGSRHPETGFLPKARRFAREVAEAGLGVLSGAAEGVDQACHWGALDAGAPTWAFVGSGLDALDPAQARLRPHVLAGGGRFYSEYPPGVRASRATFPRRNRLIAGSADVVVALRAGKHSGALHTVEYGLKLGRPVLALPGDLSNPAAEGCLQLLADGTAALCTGAAQVLEAAGGAPAVQAAAAASAHPRQAPLSSRAAAVLDALGPEPRGMDDLLEAVPLGPAELSAGLVELELAGRCIQRPGRRYEKA